MDANSDQQRLLEELVDKGLAVGAAGLVAEPRRVLWSGASGAARRDSVFDLASLTKPFTASLALRLEATGVLRLPTVVGDIWPDAHPVLAARSLEDLLRHRSRLLSWAPLYTLCDDPEQVGPYLAAGQLLGARRDAYSDLGYILWGLSAERVTGKRLSTLFGEYLASPLGWHGLRSGRRPYRRALMTPLDTRREVALAAALGVAISRLPAPPSGFPQDGHARFLGGLGGHAGLFAAAPMLVALARLWLSPGRFLGRDRVAAALAAGGPHALGWQRWRSRNAAGPALARSSFGHIGFTGGSLWIDPERRRIFVLLAHRASVDTNLDPWRRRFHRIGSRLG